MSCVHVQASSVDSTWNVEKYFERRRSVGFATLKKRKKKTKQNTGAFVLDLLLCLKNSSGATIWPWL